jgi:hypothetical protein
MSGCSRAEVADDARDHGERQFTIPVVYNPTGWVVNGLAVIFVGQRFSMPGILRRQDGADVDPAALARTRVLGPQGAI